MVKTAAAVFLDRDGTIIGDPGYLTDPDGVFVLPGAAEALVRLAAAGWSLVVVSNQSGIARGLISPDEAAAVHRRFVQVLEDLGVQLAGAYYCPHGPDDGCGCRKPASGLLEEAARDLGIDLKVSVMVGDKPSDAEAGLACGCRSILLSADDSEHDVRWVTVPDLATAAGLLTEEKK